MLREKIKNMHLSVYEFVIILAFIALGYCLLYKYSFYKTLEIPWFISNLTPQFLFLSSFKVLFFGISYFVSGYLLGILCNNFKILNKLIYANLLLVLILSGLYLYQRYNNFFFDLPILNINFQFFFMFFLVFSLGYSFKIGNFYEVYVETKTTSIYNSKPKNDLKKYINLTMIFLVILGAYISIPTSLGEMTAKDIINKKENHLNKVLLKDSVKDWYLIETMGDKVLIIDKMNNIKIIEYKELDFIQTKHNLRN